MSTNLHKIDNALQDLQDKRYKSIRQAARAHDIDKSSLAHRLRGRKPRALTFSSQQRLTPAQEIVLVHWIEDLQHQILPSNHSTIRQIVIHILKENDDLKPLGKNWTTKFIKRHPQLATMHPQRIDISRLTTLDPSIITTFFTSFRDLCEQYQVEDQDIYNMNEKGFQMGQTNGEQVIVNKSMRPPVIPSIGTSKWVTIIECISAAGQVLQPMVIHLGKNPKDHWFPPTQDAPDWHFGFSTSGWTDNELAL